MGSSFINILLVFLPFAFFTAIGQFSQMNQMIAAMITLFISFSLLIKTPKKPFFLRMVYQLKKGFILATGLFTIICCFPIGGWLALPLLLQHSQQPAQAIVVLASGSSPTGDPGISGFQRVLHGLELFREKKAPRLFISTGYSSVSGLKEASWVASLTKVVKHPDNGMEILVDKAITTSFTEGNYIAKKLIREKITTIILVTSASHMLRASLCYKKLGFNVLPAPTHNAKNIFYDRGSYLASYNAIIHEWVGLLYYKLLGRI